MTRSAELTYRGAEALRTLADRLPAWYQTHRRELPWRETGDPYDVWISEIMLQQTRVAAVVSYFRRFKAELPGVAQLAACDDERLMKLWEGLGYYSRARNLKKAAQVILEEYGGQLPREPEQLRTLPGIGPYTAGAIASIAYGVPVPAVDGNVLRVCSRLCGNDSDIGLPQTRRALEAALGGCLREGRGGGEAEEPARIDPAVFNQALMELGALICLPNGAPECDCCPMRGACAAERAGMTSMLPVKQPKKPRRIEQRTVLVIESGMRCLIRKRPGSGLLAGLWEFPSVEGALSEAEALEAAERILAGAKKQDGPRGWAPEALRIRRLSDARHIFTHIEWHMRAWQIRVAEIPAELVAEAPRAEAGALRLADASELNGDYALPNAFAPWLRDLRH